LGFYCEIIVSHFSGVKSLFFVNMSELFSSP
jgi:hypothetical protein